MHTNTLIIPRGLIGLAPLHIDLTEVNIAEARIAEVATVTPTKAPELLALFNKAFLDAAAAVCLLEMELVHARKTVDKIRSVIVLDRAPQILKDRGLATSKNPAGSEDLRRAVIEGDEEYQLANTNVDIVHSYLSLLKSKGKGIEMAFSSVKRILQEQAFNYGSPISNRPLSAGGTPDSVGAGQTVSRQGFATHNRY